MQIILILASVGIIIYSITFHRKGSRKNFYFISYWKNLTAKGAVIYTLGLILLFYAVLLYR